MTSHASSLASAERAALSAVRLRLVLRHALRVGALGVLAGSVASALAVLFASVLAPWLIGAFIAAPAAALGGGLAGFAGGALAGMRRYRAPDARDCALVLEAGDDVRGAALVTLVGLPPENPFAQLLLAPAAAELKRRAAARFAPALPLWLLLAAPAAALGAAVLAGAVTALPRVPYTRVAAPAAVAPRAVDVASGRTAADAAAYAAALKMTRAAADMKDAAATLSDPAASAEARRRALDKAARAGASAANVAGSQTHVPGELPAGEQAQADLAATLSAAAARFIEIAGEFESGKRTPGGASGRSAGGEDFARNMAPFPAFEARAGAAGPDMLVMQPAPRRELAQRAVELAGE